MDDEVMLARLGEAEVTRELGVRQFLHKPLDLERFAAAVAAALGRGPREV